MMQNDTGDHTGESFSLLEAIDVGTWARTWMSCPSSQHVETIRLWLKKHPNNKYGGNFL
jgi:hypothetical protein